MTTLKINYQMYKVNNFYERIKKVHIRTKNGLNLTWISFVKWYNIIKYARAVKKTCIFFCDTNWASMTWIDNKMSLTCEFKEL